MKIYNFYFGNFLRDVKFMNNVTTALLDEQTIKIKVVDLKKLQNFVVFFET